MRATAEQRTHSLKIEEYQVEAYVYLVTGTALGELNRSNPLEPQKFKKRSGLFPVDFYFKDPGDLKNKKVHRKEKNVK